MMRLLAIFAAVASLVAAPLAAKPPLVLAAASLQGSLDQVADAWAKAGHERPTLSYAGSSALARQIEAGAPADLFISADEEWMDHVAAKGLVKPGTRGDVLHNELVLIAPASSTAKLRVAKGMKLAEALGDGRLAMADPAAVPAGKYGKAALTALGVWPSVEAKVASAENVRAALALVERGQTPFGIVYTTDAKASGKVRIVGTFPSASHEPILYPAAVLASATSGDAAGFRAFLMSSTARSIFAKAGFGTR